jgi:hypothetical protein
LVYYANDSYGNNAASDVIFSVNLPPTISNITLSPNPSGLTAQLTVLAGILYLSSKYYFIATNDFYVIFHNLIEIFTVVISFFVFYIANKSYKLTKSETIRIIGFSFLAMAVIDIFHIVGYKGFPIPIFHQSGNTAAWFWISSRFIGALIVFLSALFGIFSDKLEKYANYVKYFTISIVPISVALILLNISGNFLPPTFVEGQGLTMFKIVAEYVIMGLLLATSLIFGKIFLKNKSKILMFFILGFLAGIFSEAAFTLYKNVYDIFNINGHILRLISYVLFVIGLKISFEGRKM